MPKSVLHFISVLTVMLITFSSAHKTWIRLSYELNKLEIIEKFCINKEDVSMQCEGKCHLKTQLKKADESQPSSDNQLVEEYNLILYTAQEQKSKIHRKTYVPDHNSEYINTYSYLLSKSLFRPPRA